METLICDLDEVVFDWLREFIPYMKEEAYKDHIEVDQQPIEGDCRKWTSWNGFENFGLSDKEFLRYYYRFCDDSKFKTLPLISRDVKLYLNKAFDNFKIVFVTARPPRTINDTLYSLLDSRIRCDYTLIHISDYSRNGEKAQIATCVDGHGMTINEIEFSSKRNVFVSYKPQVVIDDRDVYIQDAIDVGVPYVFIMCRNHNKKWRKDNIDYTKAISDFAYRKHEKFLPLSVKIQNSLVCPVYNWKQINTGLHLIKEENVCKS